MKELDFDELDRAVSSLMGSVPKTAPVAPQEDGMKTLTITPTLGTSNTPPTLPVVPTPSVPAQEASDVAPTPSLDAQLPAERSSLATRRSGRFMDVVHTSSDMTRPTAARPVSRQGVTLEPTSTTEDTVSSEPIAAPTEVSPIETQDEPELAPVSTHDWPDPLDMSDTQHASPEEDKPEASTEDSTVADDLSVAEVETAAEGPIEPLNSPFLVDAKVEKRPLGGVLETNEPELEQAEDTQVAEEAQPPVDTVSSTLPEELQEKLAAIEAGVPMDEEVEAPVQPVSRPVAAAPTPVVEAATPAPAGPVSIPQQYREEPTTSDQTNGAIYDTSDYHQPLDHPAKKKSGWLWIVWVLILLVLGGAGGAAAYLYLLN